MHPSEFAVHLALRELPRYEAAPHAGEEPAAVHSAFTLLGADLDASWTVALSDGVRLMPRVGASSDFGVALGEDGGAGGALGYNVGIGLLQRTSPTTAVRLDYTYRRFGIERESLALSSLTIGFVWMH